MHFINKPYFLYFFIQISKLNKENASTFLIKVCQAVYLTDTDAYNIGLHL